MIAEESGLFQPVSSDPIKNNKSGQLVPENGHVTWRPASAEPRARVVRSWAAQVAWGPELWRPIPVR